MIDPVELTQKLIRCESITPQDKGAQKVMAEPLEAMGFKISWLPFVEEKTELVENFFARLGTKDRKSGGKHLCYMGHTDVVPVGRMDDWTYPPFAAEIHDGKLYGRGASDMKSANAAFVVAAQRFQGDHPNFVKDDIGSISLLITGDEEGLSVNGTIKVVDWLKRHDQLPDVALVGEPSNADHMGQRIQVGRRGSWNGKLRVQGVQGHSAYPEKADNPVPKMVEMLHKLAQHRLDEGNEFFPPSHLVLASVDVGNNAFNIIPARVEAMVNIRYNSLWTRETLESHVRSLLDECGYAYELESWSYYQSFLVKDTEWRDLVAGVVQEASGHKPIFNTAGGASDACHISPYCPVVEYGVTNATIHKVDEHVEVKDIEELTETYRLILEKFFYPHP